MTSVKLVQASHLDLLLNCNLELVVELVPETRSRGEVRGADLFDINKDVLEERFDLRHTTQM